MCRTAGRNRAAEGRELVFHEAAIVSVPYSVEHPRETHAVNVQGTLNVALAARDGGYRGVMVPKENAAEAALVDRIEVIPVESIQQAVSHLSDSGFSVPFRYATKPSSYFTLSDKSCPGGISARSNGKRKYAEELTPLIAACTLLEIWL